MDTRHDHDDLAEDATHPATPSEAELEASLLAARPKSPRVGRSLWSLYFSACAPLRIGFGGSVPPLIGLQRRRRDSPFSGSRAPARRTVALLRGAGEG